MQVLSCCIDQNIQKYENIIFMEDYNAEITETSMQELWIIFSKKYGEKKNKMFQKSCK